MRLFKPAAFFISFSFLLFFSGCKSTEVSKNSDNIPVIDQTEISETQEIELEQNVTEETQTAENQEPEIKDEITLLFAGDVMAHSVNYVISDYPKIWRDIKDKILPCDLAFANIEAPIDTTKGAQTYPNFNMTKKFSEAFVDAGFDVFSMCNNHSLDQGINGVRETIKTTEGLVTRSLERGEKIYFSGLKNNKEDEFTYNVIEKNGWTILFIPISELSNHTENRDYMNYVRNEEKSRTAFIKFAKELREKHPCDLFIISVHTAEVEYTRNITKSQNKYYMDLIETANADIIWANHAHIIKDRKYIFNAKNHTQKVIMYANGNTISGQRTKPELSSKNPTGERDNTGDGLMVKLTFSKKDQELPPQLCNAENIYITTYINTANEYVIKPLNQDFINYLYDVPRKSWAEYVERRIKINEEQTKDLILWQ